MSRYNVTKYNGGVYGVNPSSGLYEWQAEIFWDGHTSQDIGVTLTDVTVRQGRSKFIGEDGFGRYDIGEALLIARNDDDRYTPMNASSPLYPYVRPGPKVRLSVTDGAGTTYSLMRGYVYDVQTFAQGGDKFARFVVRNPLQWLQGKTVRLPYQASATADALVKQILAAVDWPTSEWYTGNLAVGMIIDHYWGYEGDALTEIYNLMNVKPNPFYCSRSGQLISLDDWSSYTNTLAIDESECLREITLAQPWQSMCNHAEVASYRISTEHLVGQDLWYAQVPILLPASQGFIFYPHFDYGDYVNVGPAVVGKNDFDYIVLRVSDNADITGSCPLNGPFGDGSYVIENMTGDNGKITTLLCTGDFDVLERSNEPTWRYSDNPPSQAFYGKKSIKVDNPVQQNTDSQTGVIAYQYAFHLVSELCTPQTEPTIQIENRPSKQFPISPGGTQIHLTAPTLGIDDDFRVGYVEHRWRLQTGQGVVTTLRLEPWLASFNP